MFYRANLLSNRKSEFRILSSVLLFTEGLAGNDSWKRFGNVSSPIRFSIPLLPGIPPRLFSISNRGNFARNVPTSLPFLAILHHPLGSLHERTGKLNYCRDVSSSNLDIDLTRFSLKLSKNRRENKCYSPENIRGPIPRFILQIIHLFRKKKQDWNLHESSNSTVAIDKQRNGSTFPRDLSFMHFPTTSFRVRSPVLDTLNYCPGTGAPATVLRIWLSDFAYSKAAGCVASLPRKRASISVEEENYCNHYPSKERNSLLLISGSFSNLADTLELEIGFVISQEMDCSISNIYAPFETGWEFWVDPLWTKRNVY